MSFYGPDQVERVREATDLAGLFARYVTLKKAGPHHVASCCFHTDRTGSLHIYPDHYHCFGCGAHGDVFTLLQTKEHFTFQEAVARLAKENGVALEDRAKRDGKAAEENLSLYAACEVATAHYEATLWTPAGEAALAYLRGRSISDEMIRTFRIGWAEFGMIETATNAGISEATLRAANLAVDREGALRSRFWRRITLPILDGRGRPTGFTARLLPDDEKKFKDAGKPVGKYINTAETPIFVKGRSVFNLQRARSAARDAKRLILVEGALDVLALTQAGMPEAAACLGTAMTADQAQRLAAAVTGGAPVIVALDGDRAGKAAQEAAVRGLIGAGASVQVADWGEGDPDELLIQEENDHHDPEIFTDALLNAAPGVHWLLRLIAPKPLTLDVGHRIGLLNEVCSLVNGAKDQAYRTVVVRTAAKHLNIDARTANRLLRAKQAPGESDGEGPRRVALTDYGNAQRFLARCRGEVLYCREWKAFVIWTGKFWEVDDGDESEAWRRYHAAMTSHLADEIADARASGDSDRVGRLLGWREASDSKASHAAAIEHARRLADWQVRASDFDRDPFLLSCRNGTLDLRNGQLREFDKEQRITRLAEASWQGDLVDERWVKFVEHLAGDPEIFTFLRRFLGYSATAIVTEKAIVVLRGDGDSGKTTFVNAVSSVLGTYAGTLNAENFLQQQQTQKRWELANADHARFVAIEEVGTEGRGFAIDFLKAATGGNMMTAERKFAQPYTFKPVWKLLFVCNDPPLAPAGDNATWNRINLVQCAPPPAVKDKGLGAHFASELGRSAILAWIVAGARDYLELGSLAAPAAVKLATAQHRAECDFLFQYLDEAWTIGSEDNRVSSREFMAEFHAWCRIHGHKEPSARSVLRRLTPHGVEADAYIYDQENGRSIRAWSGIRRQQPNDKRWSSSLAPDSPQYRPASPHLARSEAKNSTSGAGQSDADQGTQQTYSTNPTAGDHQTPDNLASDRSPTVENGSIRGESEAKISPDPHTTSADSPHLASLPGVARDALARENPVETSISSSSEGEGDSSEVRRSRGERLAAKPSPSEDCFTMTPEELADAEAAAEERAAIQAEAAGPAAPSDPSTAPAFGLGADFNAWPGDLRNRHSDHCAQFLQSAYGITTDPKTRRYVGPADRDAADLSAAAVHTARAIADWMRGLTPFPTTKHPDWIT